MPIPPDLLGPYALLVGALIVVGVLWREHQRSASDDRKERDEWKAIALESQRDIGRLTRAVEAALNIKVPPAS